MSTTNNVNASKGKRYTEKEKGEILAYVDKVNSEKGRGGQSAASKKYKISQLTISSWLRGGAGSGTVRVTTSGKGGGLTAKVGKLTSLAAQIDKAEKDLDKLKAQFKSMQASLV
jgi:hypothetical protein